uniref:Uncharacterized protein n=1 Tax=Photinus pyralis TaxID=7054 RepID=A0A1Y1KAD1_PHOPY
MPHCSPGRSRDMAVKMLASKMPVTGPSNQFDSSGTRLCTLKQATRMASQVLRATSAAGNSLNTTFVLAWMSSLLSMLGGALELAVMQCISTELDTGVDLAAWTMPLVMASEELGLRSSMRI